MTKTKVVEVKAEAHGSTAKALKKLANGPGIDPPKPQESVMVPGPNGDGFVVPLVPLPSNAPVYRAHVLLTARHQWAAELEVVQVLESDWEASLRCEEASASGSTSGAATAADAAMNLWALLGLNNGAFRLEKP